MIGIIYIVCFGFICLALYVGIADRKIPQSKEEVPVLIEKAKTANLIAISMIAASGIFELVFLIDFFLNGALFHVDYLEVWGLTILFGFFVLGLAIVLLFSAIKDRLGLEDEITGQWIKKEKAMADKQARQIAMAEKNESERAKISSILPTYDKVIKVDEDRTTGYEGWLNALYVDLSGERIIISGRLFMFKDIISCLYTDNIKYKSSQTGTASSVSKTDTGSMIGRAVVGGLVAGEMGAIIGGTTASQQTETIINTTTTTDTIHNYTVIVNTTDILQPVCEINCGKNFQLVTDIVGTINAIIKRVGDIN